MLKIPQFEMSLENIPLVGNYRKEEDKHAVVNEDYYGKIPYLEPTSETGLNTEELIKLCHEICSKTVEYDLVSVKKEEMGTFIKNLVEKATNGEWTTNGVDGLSEGLIVYKKDDSNDISN